LDVSPSLHPPSSSLHPPTSVLLINAEDDPADTIRPRLEAAGADLDHIYLLNDIHDDFANESYFWSADDLEHLEDALLLHPDIRLVIIDPVAAFTGYGSGLGDSALRSMFMPLARVAESCDVGVLVVTHLRKGSGGRALHRLMGSLTLTALARSVWLATRDPASPARRLLLPVKNNLQIDPTGLAFRLSGNRVEWDTEQIRTTADQALASETGGPDADPTAIARAAGWLEDLLSNGPKPAREIFLAARDCGLSPVTLRRAKNALGVEVRKDVYQGPWVWCLSEPSLLAGEGGGAAAG
jgi:hypothetical protein